jgi:hypothetical protein
MYIQLEQGSITPQFLQAIKLVSELPKEQQVRILRIADRKDVYR